MRVLAKLYVLVMVVLVGAGVAQAQIANSENASVAPMVTMDNGQVDKPEQERPSIKWGDRKIYFGFDFAFVSYKDGSLNAAMGRERQMLPARIVMSVYGDYNKNVSYRVEVNPVDRSITPRPYIPLESDRRDLFFPNQPDVPGGRGVASQPEGLFYVDDYKTMGVDPISHLSGLRVGYVDLHTANKRFGAQIGRVYVPQGLGLENANWFTAKDLTHIQVIDAAADNGLLTYYSTGRFNVTLGLLSGNGDPFHDYGYSDFTSDGEDKNSAIATALRATYRIRPTLLVGGSVKHNYVNSRVEDSTTLQLSKRYDNAFTFFTRWEQSRYLTVYGQLSRYKWGLRDSSADLLPGPRIQTPIFKNGYLVGMDLSSKPIRRLHNTRMVFGYVRSELDRDDSLVAWATANDLFGVRMGKRERSNVYRLEGRLGEGFSVFYFLHELSNPFPELSAIKPVTGPGSDHYRSDAKSGFGLAFRF